MTLTGKTRLAGVMGWPVSHSRSPRLHGFWLAQHKIDGGYMPLPVAPENFERAARGLAALGFIGANVTVPHKLAALKLADQVEPLAKRIGAVNTLVVQADGTLAGSNTDTFGFIENLRQSATGFKASAGPAVVLGAGGAARAVVVALLDDGAPEVRITNRTRAHAEELASAMGGRVTVVDWTERSDSLFGAALVVNTTTLGMTGQPPLEIDLAPLPKPALVHDIVYVPRRTALLESAQRRGNQTVEGLGMLLHQARPSFAAWFGVMPEVTPELRRYMDAE